MSSGRQMELPRLTVVVPSHSRPLRLRWLLNALDDQTLAPECWEVVVVHDDADERSEKALRDHGYKDEGRLRRFRLPVGTGSPSRQRNVGWRAARAALIAFTDDDCRPEPDWLERLLAVADKHPGAIVQGATRPDPYEAAVLPMTPRVRTITVDPPGPYAQTCNILYPREVLMLVGGFDERFPPAGAGEDTDLALRARATGAAYVGATAAIVNHAVETYSLPGILRVSWKWQHLAFAIKRHPQLRRLMVAGVFWRPSHALAVAGAVVAATFGPRRPVTLLVLSAYLKRLLPFMGRSPRRWLRRLIELPTRLLIDLTEILALVRGSLLYRTLFL